jgi:hypothetical protein
VISFEILSRNSRGETEAMARSLISVVGNTSMHPVSVASHSVYAVNFSYLRNCYTWPSCINRYR